MENLMSANLTSTSGEFTPSQQIALAEYIRSQLSEGLKYTKALVPNQGEHQPIFVSCSTLTDFLYR